MNYLPIILGLCAIWIIGFLIYYLKPQSKKQNLQAVIKEKQINYNNNNVNVFSPHQSSIKTLTVNLINNDSIDIDTNQFADLVLSVKDLVNYKFQEIQEIKEDITKDNTLDLSQNTQVIQKEELQLEQKTDTDFSNLLNINKLIN